MSPVANRDSTHSAPIARLASLDLLRGLCAMAVAAYHFRLWSDIPVGPGTEGLLAFFGTYGVSVFFVLSGYSLAHAYDSDFKAELVPDRTARYFRRRVGRLVPLYFLIVVLSIIGKLATTGFNESPAYVLASLSLLFGFVDPASTPVIGGWSIGIEVVFYVLFPVMMALRSRAWTFVLIGTFLTLWISSDISKWSSLEKGWRFYVQPANHFVFFAGGVACRLSVQRFDKLSGTKLVTLLLVLFAATWIISSGTQEIDLVVGLRRILLVIISVLIVSAIAQWPASGRISSISSILGGMSYPLYLVHPLVYLGAFQFLEASASAVTGIFILACALSIFVDFFVERPSQRFVKSKGW
jgi:exopolysaccharide production protein ExoZ